MTWQVAGLFGTRYTVVTQVVTWRSSMRSIGVRELKAHASAVLRGVQETGQAVEVTVRGRPVARLVPMEPVGSTADELSAVWTDLDSLAAEIGAKWQPGSSAADAVREGRREV